jgi:beta-lactamase class A
MASILISGVVGYVFGTNNNVIKPVASTLSSLSRQKTTYLFTNPLLECEQAESTLQVHIRPKSKEIEQYITQQLKLDGINDIALQYRDLLSGLRYTYNESFQFRPASLLKVPILIAQFKRLEQDPNYFQQKIVYNVDFNDEQKRNVVTPNEPVLQSGVSYTVEELLEQMIIYSSNNATNILVNLLTEEELYQSSQDLGVNLQKQPDDDFTVSVNDYASFFRVLYNASYLTSSHSEKALELLSKTAYKNGIVAGVPENVIISHKFGEREDKKTKEIQLHDCGIVYKPKRPYLLCIMTKGTNIKIQEQVIQNISKFVYQTINVTNN